MGKFILADNQELTRYALESLILSKGDHDIYKVSDRAGLVEKLKAHENAVVLLDYTLFDFADEDQLLIVAERFALSQWILVGRSFEGFARCTRCGKPLYALYQSASTGGNHQPAAGRREPAQHPDRDRDRDSESHCPGQDHQGDCQRAVFKCPYYHHSSQEHLPQTGCEHRPRSDQIRLTGRSSGLVRILHLTSKKVKRRLFTFFISRPAGYPPAGLRRLQDLC